MVFAVLLVELADGGPWLFHLGLPGGGCALSRAAAQHLGCKDVARQLSQAAEIV